MKKQLLLMTLLCLSPQVFARGARAIREYGKHQTYEAIVDTLQYISPGMGPVYPNTCVSAAMINYPDLLIPKYLDEVLPCAKLQRQQVKALLRRPRYTYGYVGGRQAQINNCATVSELNDIVKENCGVR